MLNFTSNAAALLLFALRGKVAYPAGLPMALGMMAGARLGSRLAIRRGAPFIRPLFVLVSLALAVRTGWTAFTMHRRGGPSPYKLQIISARRAGRSGAARTGGGRAWAAHCCRLSETAS